MPYLSYLMDVEPWTDIPLQASVKVQVNIETQSEPAPPAGLYKILYKKTYPKKLYHFLSLNKWLKLTLSLQKKTQFLPF